MASPLIGLPKTVYKAFKGIFLDATLTRDGANSTAAYDPTTATATTYTCKAIAQDFSTGVQGLGLVGASDISILILASSLAVQPEALDRIAIPSQGISGVVYGGQSGMKAVTSDPARATWVCRVTT